MSLISAAGGGSGLTGFLQKLTGKKNSVSTAATSQGGILQSILSAGATGGAGGVAALGGQGHGGQRRLFKKVQSAVTTALQSLAKQGGSSGAGETNPNTAIQSAIMSVLNDAADGSAAPEQNSPATSTSTAQTGQAFQQLLKANGVTPQQFQADFQSALQQVQQGGVDLSKVFKSFSPGAPLVNLTA